MHPTPAILGGPPTWPEGPPTWPPADEEIRAALERAFAEGSWGRYSGGEVEALEAELADYHEVPHALTCASGTLAVELALAGVGVGPGDEVVLSSYDFPGNFLAVIALGATPVLVDVEPGGLEPGVASITAALGPRTRAVVVSHLHGSLAPMPGIMAATRERGVAVVEDACQCPGAQVEGRRAGTWGDAGVLSFGGSKLLTAGRGGAVLTARAEIAQRIRTRQFRGNMVGPLSELQAAVLRPQLARLDERNRLRRDAVQVLMRQLEPIRGIACARAVEKEWQPAYYKLALFLNEGRFGLKRTALVAALRAEGLALDDGFRAAHIGRSPKRFRAAGPLREAERASAEVVMLHHPILLTGVEAMEQVAGAFGKIRLAAADIDAHLRKSES